MQLSSGRPVRRGVAVSITAVAVAACGSSAMSHRAGMPKIDVAWSALRVCVMNSASVPLDGEVARVGTRTIRVYDAYDHLVAGINYERTFAHAEAQAKRHQVPAGSAPSKQKTGSWLAIGNVAYFFSFMSTPSEIHVVTACLAKTYSHAPKWPPNVALGTLSNSPFT